MIAPGIQTALAGAPGTVREAVTFIAYPAARRWYALAYLPKLAERRFLAALRQTPHLY
jgi:hypothetical protein